MPLPDVNNVSCQILMSLRHSNLVRCLGQYQVPDGDGGQEHELNFVMEPCQCDLEHLLVVREKFSPVEAVYIIKQILEGLDYLHDKNIIIRYLITYFLYM